jgi:hypothetical protein
VRPDGTEYPEATFVADARGELTHTISIILTETGTYELQMVDEATKAVATTRFMITTTPIPPIGRIDRAPSALDGVWHGDVVGSTAAGPRRAAVLLSFSGGEPGGIVGTIAYPSLGCGGELWLLGARGDVVVIGEQITYGEERCEAHGILSVRSMAEGRLEVERRTAEEPQAAPATAILRRRQ